MVTSSKTFPRRGLLSWDPGVRRLLSGRKLLGRGEGKQDILCKEVPEGQAGQSSEGRAAWPEREF